MPFDYTLPFKSIDFRAQPDLYRIGKGEQGVLLVRPYKDEILPHWRFRTEAIAKVSSKRIYELFEEYLKKGDFVGADMARKFLQMGYTRARRYANHKGGRKYDGPVPLDKKGQSGAHGRKQLPLSAEDPEKAAAARVFYESWRRAVADVEYQRQRSEHEAKFGK